MRSANRFALPVAVNGFLHIIRYADFLNPTRLRVFFKLCNVHVTVLHCVSFYDRTYFRFMNVCQKMSCCVISTSHETTAAVKCGC